VLKTLSAGAIVFAIAACKLLLYFFTGRHYGYFVDELYYLACSRHLDWGYVDQPPLIAVVVWLWRSVLGQSLAAIRLLPALAGVAEVLLTALMARELGGKRFAQALAAMAALIAPGVLAADGLLTMNAFEPLFWMGCAYLLIRLIKTEAQRVRRAPPDQQETVSRRTPSCASSSKDEKLWIWFGVLAGFGLENKYSMLIFGAGLVLGLLLTPARRLLASRWLWVGGAIAFLIFLPNLVWNFQHHFPFLELQANIRASGRDVPLGPVAFFGQEILLMHPLTLPIWLGGLWFYFCTEAGKRFRAIGWAWIFTAAVIVTLSPRVYYLFPGFPVLFAGGGVLWEQLLARPKFTWLKFAWLKPTYLALMLLGGAVLAPLAIPLLPPETYIRYTKALGLQQPAIETHELGPLPQIFADQFGWEEMAAAVAGVYNNLPPAVRARTAIFAQTYGQAGAVDLFGPKYGLPPAISGHQNYFLWGPRGYTGESVIVMDDSQENLERLFASVRKAGRVYHPYSMPYQHFDLFYCQGIHKPLQQIWARQKRWD
jgi:4-amino-4-deoxy-L-arabinose transferase-like glycosyltransferase